MIAWAMGMLPVVQHEFWLGCSMGKTFRLLMIAYSLAMPALCVAEQEPSDPIRIYRVGDSALPTETVLAGGYSKQESTTASMALTGKPDASGWWRIELQPGMQQLAEPVLYMNAMTLTSLQVWWPGNSEPVTLSQLGSLGSNNGYSPRILQLSIPQNVSAGQSVFWRVKTGEVQALRVGLKSENALRTLDAAQSRWHNLIEGTLIALVLAGVVLSAKLRETTFLILAFGTLLSLLFLLANNGDIFYFQSVAAWDAEFALQRIFGLAASAVMTYFSYVFLQMERYVPRIARIQKLLIAGLCGLLALCFVPGIRLYSGIALAGNLLILSSAITVFISSIILIRKGNRLGRLYLISWAPLCFLATWRVVEVLLQLPFNTVVSIAFPGSYVIAGILLYSGLGERMLLYKQERDASNQLARIDPLTEIYNRRALDERLQVAAQVAEKSGSQMALLFADIDHFKQINDTIGHDGGDAVLKEVTHRIRQALRFGDVFGRYGGEEFIMALPACTEFEAKQLAERIRAAVADTPVGYAERSIPVTLSIGISIFNGVGNDVDAAIKEADKALYYCKQNGRNCVSTLPA